MKKGVDNQVGVGQCVGMEKKYIIELEARKRYEIEVWANNEQDAKAEAKNTADGFLKEDVIPWSILSIEEIE